MSQWRDDELYHAFFKRKSKYKGGFIKKGKKFINTSAYNHDYYIHNKIRWLFNQGRIDDETYGMMLLMPTDWATSFMEKVLGFVEKLFPKKTITIGEDISPTDVKPTNTKPEETKPKSEETKPKPRDIKSWDEIFPKEETPTERRRREYHELLANTKHEAHKYRYKVYENGKWRYFYTDAEYYSHMLGFKVKSQFPEPSILDEVANVNPNYFSDKRNYDENCGWCSLSYDLRKRGFDVSAGSEETGLTRRDIEKFYVGDRKFTAIDTNDLVITGSDGQVGVEGRKANDRLFDQLEKDGNGASGYIGVHYSSGNGHSLAYEVVDGKAYILDTQVNKVYDREDFYLTYGRDITWGAKNGDLSSPLYVNYLRADDLVLNDKEISRISRPHDKTIVDKNTMTLVNITANPGIVNSENDNETTLGDTLPEWISRDRPRKIEFDRKDKTKDLIG